MGSRLLLPPWISPSSLLHLPLGVPPGLSFLHLPIPPVPDAKWNPSQLYFVSRSLSHTHMLAASAASHCPSLLMLPDQVTPQLPLYLALCQLAGWGCRCYSGEVILPAHDGYMYVIHVHAGIHMCRCTQICCISCDPGGVAKAVSTMS